MKTPEENKAEFDKQQILKFVEDREEIISFVRSLCQGREMSTDLVKSFILRLDRLIDLGRYLVIKDTYIEELKKETAAEENIYEGVDLNALD